MTDIDKAIELSEEAAELHRLAAEARQKGFKGLARMFQTDADIAMLEAHLCKGQSYFAVEEEATEAVAPQAKSY